MKLKNSTIKDFAEALGETDELGEYRIEHYHKAIPKDSINGMSIGETEYKVFFADKSMQTYVCGLKSVGIYTDKGATNDNSSSK